MKIVDLYEYQNDTIQSFDFIYGYLDQNLSDQDKEKQYKSVKEVIQKVLQKYPNAKKVNRGFEGFLRAIVFVTNDRAIRISTLPDVAYDDWYDYCQSRNSEHLPKYYSKELWGKKGQSVIEMELLDNIPTSYPLYKELNALGSAKYRQQALESLSQKVPEFVQELKAAYQWSRSKKYNTDIRIDNFMLRDKTPVILDFVYSILRR